MKPHPRIRRTMKWGGAVVTVLLLVVWIGSGWWFASWSQVNRSGGPEWWVLGARGRVLLGRKQRNSATSVRAGPHVYYNDGGPSWEWDCYLWGSAKDWYLSVPLWIPSTACVLLTALPWRLDTLARRRARLNLCAKCNYDRVGIAAGARCPDCGAT